MPTEHWLTDSVFTVEQFLDPDECEAYIHMGEDIGFEEALVTSPQGSVLRTDIRNNQRVMFKNQPIADFLWSRAVDFVPADYDGYYAVGVNELLRFYRYDPGQRFKWHLDFPYERDNGEKSFLTLLVYLNSDFEGGETCFEDSYSGDSFEAFSVYPKQGMALFFEHRTHHNGELVTAGRKYVLRTDVMYRPTESEAEDSYDPADEW